MNDTGTPNPSKSAPADDPLFLGLASNLQVMAFVHLGKLADPGTGETVRNLPAARASIDMLQMLRRKTEGNLSDTEVRVLDHVIFELQMNFVDESSKPEPAPGSPQAAGEAAGEHDVPSGNDADGE